MLLTRSVAVCTCNCCLPYGADAFETSCLTLDDRPAVRAVVGEDAERLAYIFCAMDRAAFVFRTPPDCGEIADRFTGGAVPVSRDDFYDLCDMLFANELEQLHPRVPLEDSSLELLEALIPFVSTEAIVFYRRVFQKNEVAPIREGSPRYCTQFLHYVGDPTYPQQSPAPQLFDSSLFWENDFVDLWITVLHNGVERKVALAPDCDYVSLQRHLSHVLGLDPHRHCVLGLCENISGPMMSLSFIVGEGPWYVLPEQLYAVSIIEATAKSRLAHGLPTDDIVERPLSELIPRRFDWSELREAIRLYDSQRSTYEPLVKQFCAEVHKFGCAALRVADNMRKVTADAIAIGDVFFDQPVEAKEGDFLEFSEKKFAGYSCSKYREWFQLRVLFGEDAAGRVYGSNLEMSRRLLVLFLMLEGIARDTLAVLALGIGMPPERLLHLCDRPGLPPSMQHVLGMEETLPAELGGVYDTIHPTAALPQLPASAAADRVWLPTVNSRTPAAAPLASEALAAVTDADLDFRRTLENFPGSNVCRFFRYHRGVTEADRKAFDSSYPSTPHADIGLITIAPVSPQPALEVQSPTTELMPCVEQGLDALQDVTVMTAELLGFITRGHYRAPIHRVLPNYPAFRYSMPFFLRAHPFSLIDVPALLAGTEIENLRSNFAPDPVSTAYVMDAIVQSRLLARQKYADY